MLAQRGDGVRGKTHTANGAGLQQGNSVLGLWVPSPVTLCARGRAGGGGVMSGFEITSMILTPCQTQSVQCLQIVLPCCHCSANQTSAECCLEFTIQGGYRMAVCVSSSPSHGAR